VTNQEYTTSEVLKSLKLALPELQKKYPIAHLALFGSYARGEQTAESDIDIMVEFNKPVGIEFINLSFDLGKIYNNKKVDLVSRGSITDRYWPFVKDDVIYA